jgi:hypothetical protein
MKKKQWKEFLKFVSKDPSTLMSLVPAEPQEKAHPKSRKGSVIESP